MKLIYCHSCHDCRALDLDTWRTCECGNVGGMYDPIDRNHDRAIVSAEMSHQLSVLGLDVRWCYRTPIEFLREDPHFQRDGLVWPYEKEHKLTRIHGRPASKADVLWRIETGHESVVQRSDLRDFLGPGPNTVVEEIPAA